MTRLIEIDLNRRTPDGLVPASCDRPLPAIGERVVAVEPEDGVRFEACCARVDPDRSVVYLDVAWTSKSHIVTSGISRSGTTDERP